MRFVFTLVAVLLIACGGTDMVSRPDDYRVGCLTAEPWGLVEGPVIIDSYHIAGGGFSKITGHADAYDLASYEPYCGLGTTTVLNEDVNSCNYEAYCETAGLSTHTYVTEREGGVLTVGWSEQIRGETLRVWVVLSPDTRDCAADEDECDGL